VTTSGSPHTVARPCRVPTGFPRKRTNRACAKGAGFLPAYSQRVRSLLIFVFAIAACASPICGCAAHPISESTGSAQLGSGARVVSLMPSFADDLYAIGAGRQVVAVSAYTDVPAAKGLPRVADAASVDAEAIVAMRPSLVIGIPAQARLVEPLKQAHIAVVLLPDYSFASIFANLRTIGALTGRSHAANALVARLRRETARLHARTRAFIRQPSVFVVLGSGPIWTAGAGSYIGTLIELAGGTNAAKDLAAAYGQYSAETLLRRQPDVLVTDTQTHLDAVLDREPWRSLRAVQFHRVYAVDPKLIERPGPQYNDGLRWLVDRLAPLATR